MSGVMVSALRRMTRIPGIRGAMVVDIDAGVSVVSDLAPGVDERALAALADSVFRRSTDASTASGLGRVRTLQLESAGGHLIMAGAGALLVVALAETEAQLGLVRVEAARAAGELTG